MKPRVSIIIPVYKVEKYLEKCIESILKQSYQDLEVILIDDGSPDECGKICDSYAERDKRIHVIHKENGGVARARNDGLNIATGDYISFIDSDDWIAEDAYERMVRCIRQYKADCVIGGCVTVKEKGGELKFPKNRFSYREECVPAEDVMKNLLLHASAVWNRLFRKEVFEELRFPVNRVNDDEVMALHAYAKCKKIVFLNRPTYYYRIRENSITTSSFSIRNMDYYYNSLDNAEFIAKEFPQLHLYAEFKVEKALLYCYINSRKLPDTKEAKIAKNFLRSGLKKTWKKALKNPYLGIQYKVLMWLCSVTVKDGE